MENLILSKVFLAQTDTTVGLLSQDKKRLNILKNRPLDTSCIKVVGSLSELSLHVRVPKKHKNLLRKSKKTSFIYPNKQSLRVVKTSPHREFVLEHKWLYSTSANLTGRGFDEKWARDVADEVLGDSFYDAKASLIIKLGREKKQRIRS